MWLILYMNNVSLYAPKLGSAVIYGIVYALVHAAVWRDEIKIFMRRVLVTLVLAEDRLCWAWCWVKLYADLVGVDVVILSYSGAVRIARFQASGRSLNFKLGGLPSFCCLSLIKLLSVLVVFSKRWFFHVLTFHFPIAIYSFVSELDVIRTEVVIFLKILDTSQEYRFLFYK